MLHKQADRFRVTRQQIHRVGDCFAAAVVEREQVQIRVVFAAFAGDDVEVFRDAGRTSPLFETLRAKLSHKKVHSTPKSALVRTNSRPASADAPRSPLAGAESSNGSGASLRCRGFVSGMMCSS